MSYEHSVVIIEDNISNSIELEMLFEKLAINVMGIFKSGIAAMNSIRKLGPDFVVIDLLLENNESGFDTIEILKREYIPYIICTAYPKKEFVDRALINNAEAFFSKPLDESAFIFKVKKLLAELDDKSYNSESIVLKDKRNLVKVLQSEIVRVETEGNYSYVFLKSDKKYVQKISLLKIKEQLDSKIFIQCFRSALVNKKEIVEIDRDQDVISLSDGSKVQIGYKFRNEVLKSFNQTV